MNTLQAVHSFRLRLEAWLESLKKIPSPKPQTPEPPHRKPKSPPIQRKIPMKPINDAALRAEYAARWKELVAQAEKQIEAAKEKIASLNRELGSFTDAKAMGYYLARFRGKVVPSPALTAAARKAYAEYLRSQIKYYEGFAKLSPEKLAKQMLGGFL